VTAAEAALDGIRVVDFGQFIAGPLCAALLGDFGAEVIRVERPGGAADRTVQPLGDPALPGGAVYLQVNRNKRSLALDPFDPRARPVVDRLIGWADVVVANVPRTTLETMGLAYERIAAVNPRAILATCSAFGDGPLADLPGFDGIGQAMSGAMVMSGTGGEPRKAYAHYVDHLSAVLGAYGVMAALRAREATGRGQQVETSLVGSALFAMAANLVEETVLGVGRTGRGNRAQLAGPADVYATRDGHVLVQVIGNSMFRRCVRLLDRPDWLADPRFASDESRGAHGALLSEVVAAWCVSRTTEACVAAFRGAGLPVAPVLTPRGALEHPDLPQARLWTRPQDNSDACAVQVLQPPLTLSATPGGVRTAAPALGAHSRAILDEIGLDRAAADALMQAGVVTTTADREPAAAS
jgi:crotonobetainyl-CoA:carnitine CoA-transferase CaiB-like acyl-CoA transferase